MPEIVLRFARDSAEGGCKAAEHQKTISSQVSENGLSGSPCLIRPWLAMEGGMDEMINEGAEGLGINYVMVVAVSAALLVVALGLLYLGKQLLRKRLHPVVLKAMQSIALTPAEFYGTAWSAAWGKRKGWTIFDAWANHDDCVGDCINPSAWSSSLRASLLSIIKRLSGKLKHPGQDFKEVSLLSIGSGVATVEGLLRSDGFKNIIALDNMFQAAGIAHRKGLRAVQADGLRLPFKDGSVRMTYMDGVLGHLVKSYDPPFDSPYHAALIEVRRVLASDGVLVLVDNPLEEWQESYVVDVFVQMLRARTPEMLAELDKAGFEVLGGEDLKGVWNANPDFIKYPRPNRRAAGKEHAYYVRRIIFARRKAESPVEQRGSHPGQADVAAKTGPVGPDFTGRRSPAL